MLNIFNLWFYLKNLKWDNFLNPSEIETFIEPSGKNRKNHKKRKKF